MKKIYTLIITVFICFNLFAGSLTKEMTVDGKARTYTIFTPENYNSSEQVPLLLFLHPNGYSISECAEICSVQKICNTINSIVVLPQALDIEDQEIINLYNFASTAGINFPGLSTKYVWGAGVSVSTDVIIPYLGNYSSLFSTFFPNMSAAKKIQFNSEVDDIKFINQVIDSVETSYDIEPNEIYMIGASMGGAMTYKYVFSDESKIKAAAVICGFIGADVDTAGKSANIPMCIFHSESDSIVAYDGGYLSQSIPSTVSFIAEGNGCGEYTIEDISNIADDSITVQTYSYDCEQEKKVLFYNIKGAKHQDILTSDYTTGPNDIDYYEEIYDFFFGKRNRDSVDDIEYKNQQFLYPNPAKEIVYSHISGNYKIMSIDGRVLQAGTCTAEGINISELTAGQYIFMVENGDVCHTSKLVKK